MTDYLNHEGRISRLEGIIEQIDKRLGTIERVGFSILAVYHGAIGRRRYDSG